ncbi:MAG: hypothetical protein ACRYF5_08610 [Janthinobacterium lividum]
MQGVNNLKEIFTEDLTVEQFSKNMNDLLASKIFAAAKCIDGDAIMENKKRFGFKTKILRPAAESPAEQTVIADQLVAFAMARPEDITNSVRGDLQMGEHLAVEENPNGNILELGPIAGKAGEVGNGERAKSCGAA